MDLKKVIKVGIFMVMNNYSELLRGDKVRDKTPPEINQAIDIETAAIVRFYAGKTDYERSKRIEELDKEWDIERCVEIHEAGLSFIGVMLGLKRSKKWLLLPLMTSILLLQYAIWGWTPYASLLRRFGIRTRQEIDLEKYALKALCGEHHHEDHYHGEHHHGEDHHGDHHHGDHHHGDHHHGNHYH
jgi:hypothetical protein